MNNKDSTIDISEIQGRKLYSLKKDLLLPGH